MSTFFDRKCNDEDGFLMVKLLVYCYVIFAWQNKRVVLHDYEENVQNI